MVEFEVFGFKLALKKGLGFRVLGFRVSGSTLTEASSEITLDSNQLHPLEDPFLEPSPQKCSKKRGPFVSSCEPSHFTRTNLRHGRCRNSLMRGSEKAADEKTNLLCQIPLPRTPAPPPEFALASAVLIVIA